MNLKLCAFWRSAAHSVHDNFLTIHCGPKKVYIFEVCEVIASAWIKWFSRKLSFSTTYPSQKKVHKCFLSPSGGLLVISVTISQAVKIWDIHALVLISGIHFYSHSLRKESAGMSQVLFVGSVDRLISTGLNHTFLAKSALKQYFHRKKMSQCTLCEKWKHSYQNCLRYGRKSAETVTSYWSPLMILPRFFFRLWKIITKCPGKNLKNLRQCFVVRSMLNKCAKFHGDSPSS